MKKESSVSGLYLLPILFIAGFKINWMPNYIFTPLHELGHVVAAILSGGGGQIVAFDMAMISGGINAFISYGGTYGEVFFITLIIIMFAIWGGKLYIPVFYLGGMLASPTDLLVTTNGDWHGASAFAIGLFFVYFVFMVAVCIAAVIYMIIRWYYPEQYVEIPAITKFKKEFRKQAGSDNTLTKRVKSAYN